MEPYKFIPKIEKRNKYNIQTNNIFPKAGIDSIKHSINNFKFSFYTNKLTGLIDLIALKDLK